MARLAVDHLTVPAKWPRQDLHIGISDARVVSNQKPAAGKRDVYIYFDNDAKVHAPFNAKALARKLRLQGAAL